MDNDIDLALRDCTTLPRIAGVIIVHIPITSFINEIEGLSSAL